MRQRRAAPPAAAPSAADAAPPAGEAAAPPAPGGRWLARTPGAALALALFRCALGAALARHTLRTMGSGALDIAHAGPVRLRFGFAPRGLPLLGAALGMPSARGRGARLSLIHI